MRDEGRGMRGETTTSSSLVPHPSSLIPRPSSLSASSLKELHQHRSDRLRSHLVRLTFQGAVLPLWHRVCECHCRVVHERITLATVHDERGHSNSGCSPGRYRRILAQGGGIVRNSGRYRFPHW